MFALDAIDHRILNEVQADGRITNQALAERVGLSPSPCLRRVRALEEAGVIKGYVGLVDPNTSSFFPGCPFRAMTGFDCPGCGATRALHSAVTGHPLQALDHNAFLTIAVVLGVVGFAVAKVRRRMGRPAIALRLPTSAPIAITLPTCRAGMISAVMPKILVEKP